MFLCVCTASHLQGLNSTAAAGCLGQYIEELLEVGKEVLPMLPPDAKASLLAIARRQVCLLLLSMSVCYNITCTNVTFVCL